MGITNSLHAGGGSVDIGVEFALSSRSFPINNQTPRAADNLESAKNVFHLQGLFQQECITISASYIATGPEVSRRDFHSTLDPIPVPRLRDITPLSKTERDLPGRAKSLSVLIASSTTYPKQEKSSPLSKNTRPGPGPGMYTDVLRVCDQNSCLPCRERPNASRFRLGIDRRLSSLAFDM
jgi:hypothetical protein